MVAATPCSVPRARALGSLALLAGMVVLGAGCERRESASLGAESGAVRPDTAAANGAPVADFKSVAAKVVGQSAGVAEGDLVLISGTDQDLPLLEDIAIEVRKAGAHPLVTVNTPRFGRRTWNATLEVDGTVLVKDGKLVAGPAMAGR